MNTRRGMTMVELILALALSLVILGAASTLLIIFFRNYTFSFNEQQSVVSVQQTMTTMIREIREARQAASGAWPLVETGDSAFAFYSDVTNDHIADLVRYYLEGPDLKKSVTEATGSPPAYDPLNAVVTTLASNVVPDGQPLFTYYNGDWPADTATNPLPPSERISQTAYMELFIRITLDPDDPTNVYEGKTGVQLKNLKRN